MHGDFEINDCNYYTYDSMRSMINDIRHENEMLVSCRHEDEFECRWNRLAFILQEMDRHAPLHESLDEGMRLAYYINILCDYRERFCRYMEGLMRISGDGLICFAGP